jgi:methionine biosynthesis protein MetW
MTSAGVSNEKSGIAASSVADIRRDLRLIADMVAEDSRVLDVGCGEGELLAFLERTKGADARGIEISQDGVNACVAHGLSVVQGDADRDLAEYPTDAFDYAILSQTLQATHNPRQVLKELLRVGRRAIVSFPNFGNWRIRLYLMFRGRMPMTKTLDQAWYETPNIHLCTIRDFVMLCEELGIRIERSVILDGPRNARVLGRVGWYSNLFGSEGIFLLRR